MIKLYRARSFLHRRQNLQENIRWKALDEIYKIYMLLHRSDLNISAKFIKQIRIFRQCLQIFLVIFEEFSSNFAQILMNIYRMFANYYSILETIEHSLHS